MSEQDQATTYYYVDGRRVPLFVEPNVFAVRFKAGEHADSAELSSSSRRLVSDDSTHVGFIPNYGIQIFEREPAADPAAPSDGEAAAPQRSLRAVRELNDEGPVAFATPALRQAPDSPDLLFATNRFLAQFMPEVTRQQIDELNTRHHVRVVEPLDYAPNAYLLEALETAAVTNGVALANAYFESGLTVFSHPDFIKRRHWRSAPAVFVERPGGRSDGGARSGEAGGYLGQQWHLARAKVIDAWGITKGSPGIRIAILDDGVDLSHPEVSQKVVRQFDFAAGVEDASPKSSTDRHGTACAGVAAAAGVKAFGAAPDCSLIAVRTPEYLGVADEARMFKWAADNGADVISCSWGPRDGTGQRDPLPEPTRAAIHHCVEQGRGGRGIPVCWAAGNGNESVSPDGYASNPEVIAVAALTSKGGKAWYSDYGKEVWICAPSSGDKNAGEQSIFTIDRRGAQGYNAGTASKGDPAGDYTNTFGGTSAAAPLVAGIAGLMLAANPELRWDQVKEILKQTAEKVGGGYDARGHSDGYGYGCVDALAAVRAAKNPAALPDKPQPTVTPSVPPSPAPQPPFIRGPARYPRAGAPPTFKVEAGANRFYAVEVSTRPELFARSKFGAERDATNFHASWHELPFLSAPSYTLPPGAWQQLRNSKQLYYRLWTTGSRTGWADFKVTVGDDSTQLAPSVELTGEPAPPVPSISFPSGAVFDIVERPLDGNDYRDTAGGGVVPLIEVAARGGERLARNFQVKDLAAADQPRYARISPELVAALQRLRERVGAPLTVMSAYRHPAFNESLGGSSSDPHLAGLAVDLECADLSPLALARQALDVLGGQISISASESVLHIDIRGPERACLKMGGAKMAASRDIPGAPGRDNALPWITGPLTHDAGGDPPTFTLELGRNRFYAVEVTADGRLFDRAANEGRRTPTNFYVSWRDGLHEAQGPTTTYTLPASVWDRLRSAERLYYRLLTTSSRKSDWPDYQTSTPDDKGAEAPRIDLLKAAARRAASDSAAGVARTAKLDDEALWSR